MRHQALVGTTQAHRVSWLSPCNAPPSPHLSSAPIGAGRVSGHFVVAFEDEIVLLPAATCPALVPLSRLLLKNLACSMLAATAAEQGGVGTPCLLPFSGPYMDGGSWCSCKGLSASDTQSTSQSSSATWPVVCHLSVTCWDKASLAKHFSQSPDGLRDF